MISEANGHPRHAVDVQRVQSKPGHPHATVVVSKLYTVREKKQAGKRKKVKNRVSDSVTVRGSTGNKEYVPETICFFHLVAFWQGRLLAGPSLFSRVFLCFPLLFCPDGVC